MDQKKYLKWYHKVGYGSGDVAGNCVYAIKKKTYCAVSPQFIGIAKQATSATEQPMYGQSIQGRALPIFV